MNTFKSSALATLTGATLLAVSATSYAGNTEKDAPILDRQVEAALVKVCKSTLSNKPIRMKNAMDDYNLKARQVALNVMCNGSDIITFAEINGANKVASKLQNSIGGVQIIDVANLTKVNVNFEL